MVKKEWRMKKTRLLLLLSLIIFCLFAFASCDDTEKLDSPDGLSVENTTLILNWNKVDGARLYTLSINKEGEDPREVIASKNYYSLTSLTEGTYTIKIRAKGKEGVSRDSDWSESIPFVREKESGMSFTLLNGGTEYEVTNKGSASGDIVIPDTYRGLPVTSIAKKAFFNKSDVTSVSIGKNVKSIGDFAFANCSYITSITLPEGLTSIGESAFASCRLLSGKIVIPEGVSTILKNTFAYCGSLEEIVFSNSIKSIGASAFTDCSSLTSVTLPEELESLQTLAFAKCNKIQTVVLNSKLAEIGDYAFSELTALTSVTIPDSVTRIGEGAFYLCSALAEVDLGDGVKEIALAAFRDTAIWNGSATNDVYVGKWFIGCKDNTVSAVSIKTDTIGIASFALFGNANISVLQIPDSVKTIGEGAFGQMGVTTVILGSGVKEIGQQAFVACKKLSRVVLGSYDNANSKIKDSSLLHIGDYVFRGCELLDSIEMPSTLKTVGSYAFRDTGLYKNANGVVYAGNWVVDYNEQIPSAVSILEGTVGIANYAFYNCTNLSTVSVPSSVKYVGRAAFYDCSALASVELPLELERIEDYTFYRCKSLVLLDLPPMLTYIGRSAFYKCGSSASIMMNDTDSDVLTIPSDVTYIGDYAFYNCGYSERASIEDEDEFDNYGIDTVILRDKVEYIGANAFYNFSSLSEINLGGTKVIGEKAFYKCELLKTVNFGNALTEIGDKAFYKCAALEEVKLPATLTEIGNYAFYKCESLSSLDLGGTVSIGTHAFYGDSALTKLILPESVEFIGKQAFRNCKGITSVLLSAEIDTVEQHAFYGCASMTVYADFDKNPEGWHKYWNSSYRPVVYGCEFSEDRLYVIYVEKGTVSNINSNNQLSDPMREGYTFVGWGNSATTDAPSYNSTNLSEAENGRKLYAIWAEEQN